MEEALYNYLVYVQTAGHHYGDIKRELTEKCISYINNGGVINKEWINSQQILNEALKLHKKTMIDENYGIAPATEEYRIVNELIQK